MKKTLKKSALIILIFLVVAAVIFIAVKSRSGLLLLNPSEAKDAFGYVQKLDFYTQETVNNNGEKGMQGTGFFTTLTVTEASIIILGLIMKTVPKTFPL